MKPSSLYKFIPFAAPNLAIDKKLQKKRIKGFEKGVIWYPKASDLNDPYECSPEFILENDDIEQIVNSLTEDEFSFIKDKNGISTKEKLIHLLKTPNAIKWPTFSSNTIFSTEFMHRSVFFGIISALSSHYLSETGVLSLTEKPFDLRMWSHYGRNNTGICIQFHRKENNELGSDDTTPVNYVKERQKIKFHERKIREREIITTKYNVWKYEKEWRHCKINGGKCYPFPADIKRIIFGLNCHPDTIAIIKSIFGNNMDYEEIVLNNDYSIRTDFGLKHSLSQIELDWS